MRKFGLAAGLVGLAILGVGCASETAQDGEGRGGTDRTPATAEEALSAGYARTPFGLVHPSCVHAVPDGASIDEQGIHLASGEIQAVASCVHPMFSTNRRVSEHPPATDGWTEAAWFHGSSGFSYIQAHFTVPHTPASQAGQLLYFFPSLEPENGDSIIQPVLQWGSGYAGGGNYWTMASWSLYPTNQVFFSTLTRVNAGDAIVGTVQGTGTCSGGKCSSWTITTKDTTTGGTTTLNNAAGGKTFTWANGGVLEQYGVTACNQYPNDAAITFSSIVVKNGAGTTVTPTWSNDVYSNISPQCSFGMTEPSSSSIRIAY